MSGTLAALAMAAVLAVPTAMPAAAATAAISNAPTDAISVGSSAASSHVDLRDTSTGDAFVSVERRIAAGSAAPKSGATSITAVPTEEAAQPPVAEPAAALPETATAMYGNGIFEGAGSPPVLWTEPSSTFVAHASATPRNGAWLHMATGNKVCDLGLFAPAGQELEPGTYSNATVVNRSDSIGTYPGAAERPAIAWGFLCMQSGTGSFRIDAIGWDAAGVPTSLSASITSTSINGWPLHASLRYNSSVPLKAVLPFEYVPEHSEIWFDGQEVGTTSAASPMVYENVGNAPVAFAGVTFLPESDGFEVAVGGTCSGSLAPGDTCTVDYAFGPSSAGSHHATARAAFDTEAGHADSELFGTAFYIWKLTVDGTGSGKVLCNGVECPASKTYTPSDGNTTMTARPDAGSVFSGWSGDCTGLGTCVLDATASHAVTATFATKITPGPPGIRAGFGMPGTTDASFCPNPGCLGLDSGVAVSPTAVVQLSNYELVIANRAGDVLLDRPSGVIFNEASAQVTWGSTHIVWDGLHSRWLATETTNDCTKGHDYLSVSDGPDPLGGWMRYRWDLSGNAPYDSRVGFSSDKIMVTRANRGLTGVTPCPPDLSVHYGTSSQLRVIDASTLLAEPAAVPSTLVAIPGPRAVAAVSLTAGNDGHVAMLKSRGYYDPYSVQVGLVSGTVADGTVAIEITDGVDTLHWASPVDDQSLMHSATWRAGTLTIGAAWQVIQVAMPPGQVPLLIQDLDLPALLGLTNLDPPAVGVTGDGSLAIVYATYGSPGGLFATSQLTADLRGTLRAPSALRPDGGSSYLALRGLATDPSDAATVFYSSDYEETSVAFHKSWIGSLTVGAGDAPSGTWQVDGGSAGANEFVVDVTSASASNAGAALVRLSNTGTLNGDVLATSRVFPAGGRISWDLADAATGGTTATGSKTVYLQWGDGAGQWSEVESHTMSVSSVPGSVFVPSTPARILDSRDGTGEIFGPLKSKAAWSFQVTGRAGIPGGAIAITGNLTVTGQTTAGHVTLAPTLTSGVDAPISTINFLAKPDNRANGVTVGLSSTGKLAVMFVGSTSTATAQVIFDVSGYYTKSPGVAAPTTMTYHPLKAAVRVVNTKTKTGLASRLQGYYVYGFYVAASNVIPSNAVAVTGNVTIPKGATEGTHVTVTSIPPSQDNVSTINFKTTEERANNLTVPLGAWGSLWVYYAAKTTSYCDFIFDVTGYFTADASGASYVPIAPQRILDTRPKSTSMPNNPIGFAGPLKARSAYTFAVIGRGGVPATGPVAVTGNVTITGQTAVGQLIVGPSETTGVLPAWNTLSSPTGQNRANGLVSGLNGTGRLMIMYWASSTAYTSQAIFDVSGYFK